MNENENENEKSTRVDTDGWSLFSFQYDSCNFNLLFEAHANAK